MIHFLLLQNRQGKTRLAKYYSPFEHEEKRQLQVEVHKLITKRDPKFTNFIEVTQHSRHAPQHTPHKPVASCSTTPLAMHAASIAPRTIAQQFGSGGRERG